LQRLWFVHKDYILRSPTNKNHTDSRYVGGHNGRVISHQKPLLVPSWRSLPCTQWQCPLWSNCTEQYGFIVSLKKNLTISCALTTH
jgi:hypothetical protein